MVFTTNFKAILYKPDGYISIRYKLLKKLFCLEI